MQKLSSKEIIAIWFAIIAACISITALWMPPQGIIDETVLILIGQLLLFIATLVGVDGALTRLAQVMRNRAEKPPEEAISNNAVVCPKHRCRKLKTTPLFF